MATLQEIQSDSAFESTVEGASASTLLVIYFKAAWAAPCTQMTTILSTLASTYPNDSSVLFLSIDAEELPDVSESYDVTSVPYIVLQKDGKTLETIGGSDAAKVRTAVEKHASSKSTGGKAGLPPALEATAPAQPNGATKNLSQYAPDSSDPATAPQFSSDEMSTSKDELNKRLANLVKAAPVMLFMKGTPSAPQCGFSRQLVAILRENGVKYGFFNILADDEVRQGLKEFSDWPTFPQLYTRGELVGGLDIVSSSLSASHNPPVVTFTNTPAGKGGDGGGSRLLQGLLGQIRGHCCMRRFGTDDLISELIHGSERIESFFYNDCQVRHLVQTCFRDLLSTSWRSPYMPFNQRLPLVASNSFRACTTRRLSNMVHVPASNLVSWIIPGRCKMSANALHAWINSFVSPSCAAFAIELMNGGLQKVQSTVSINSGSAALRTLEMGVCFVLPSFITGLSSE